MVKIPLTWEVYETLLLQAAATLPVPREQVQYVTGIPRGGLIAAVLLSHRFGWQFVPFEYVHATRLAGSIVVADDIFDSGLTMQTAIERIRTYSTLCPSVSVIPVVAVARYDADKFTKPGCIVPCAGKWYGKDEDIWWVFPYEDPSAEAVRDNTLQQ